MNVPVWLWFATIAGMLVLLAIDLFIVDHNPHAIKVGEAAGWVTFYIAVAILFGLGILVFSGGQYAGEYFAGYITEYSLSVDNLFVFVIIMSTFAVPAIHQHKVLLFGILAAMVLRGLFIAAGAAVIERFEWVFYIFGAFLLYTGYRLAFRRETDEEEEFKENPVLRLARRVLPVTNDYHGSAVFTSIGGRRYVTPLLIVMLAIGTTDILFALDSIPAIFGLTKEPFLVFASNAFALMGLRQLFFLLGGLLNRLVYLDTGLAVILSFIGVKLIFEALHGQGVSWAPEFGIVTSLVVIVCVLAVTTALSLLKVRRDPSAAKHLPTGTTVGRRVPDAEVAARVAADLVGSDRTSTEPVSTDPPSPGRSAAGRPGPDPVGPARAGSDEAGSDEAGVDRAGVDRAGVDRAGVDRAGVDRAGAPGGVPPAGVNGSGTVHGSRPRPRRGAGSSRADDGR